MRRLEFVAVIVFGLASVAVADQPEEQEAKAEKPNAEKPAAAAKAIVEAAQDVAQAANAEQQIVQEVVGGLIDNVLNGLFGGVVAAPLVGDLAVEAVEAAGDGPAGGDQFEQQFAPQFKPLVKAELSFIQRVMQPSKEQQQELKKVGDQALKKAVKQFADVQRKMQRGGWQMPQDGSSVYPDPRKPIQETFATKLKTMFPADKFALFEAEMAKRAEARQRVALINLVAKIDKDLVLSKEQREKITDAVQKKWKPGWEQSLEMFMHGDDYVPRPPDDAIVPFLNEVQKQAWRDNNNNQNVFWGWGWGGIGVIVEDELLIEK